MWLISASSLQRNEFDPRNVHVNVLLDKVPLGQVFNQGVLSFPFHIIPPLPFTPFICSQPCKVQLLAASVPRLRKKITSEILLDLQFLSSTSLRHFRLSLSNAQQSRRRSLLLRDDNVCRPLFRTLPSYKKKVR